MHTRLRPLSAIAIAALMALPALAATPRIIGDVQIGYDPQDFDLYLRDRDAHVAIKGDPFAVGAEAFGKAVTSLMPNKRRGATTTFTTTPGPNAHASARLVFLFNMRPVGSICGATKFVPDRDGAEIRLDAAWCHGDTEASYATGYLSSAAGVGDAGFRALVSEVTIELFPTQNRHMPSEPENGA